MQGDLISRKELIEMLTKYKFGAIKDDVAREYIKETVLRFVSTMPTAYSVEKVVEEMNKLLNEELHSVLKPLPDGTEYPEEAYRLLYLNTRLRGLIRNGGKE